MSNWWWADLVDQRLTDQLAVCLGWLTRSHFEDFTVAVTIPMEGSDGKWAVWMALSPAFESGRTTGIRILFDEDSTSDFGASLILGRDPIVRRLPRRHRDGASLAAELCRRHGGENLKDEPDGLWSFVIPARR